MDYYRDLKKLVLEHTSERLLVDHDWKNAAIYVDISDDRVMLPSRADDRRSRLSLPFNPSKCSEDRLRPFVKRAGPWLRRTPRVDLPVPCGVSDATRRKTEANRTDRPTGDFSVAGTPRRPEGSYAAWRV